MANRALSLPDARREDRDEVHYRARATAADGRAIPLLVVNMSPHGFMARSEAMLAEGDRLHIALPGVGTLGAQIRWALGGRIGCAFDVPIALAGYYELLPALTR